ncbi:MAG TPA: HyaD/HybD family hydrogenase maturation endopeptidase [Nitrospiria bacterium]
MTDPRSVVILGIGNTLMQDDGIGVWVIRALAEACLLPPRVRLIEGGIAGLRLLPDLISAEELLIVDAMNGSGPPGALYRLGPENLPRGRGPLMSAHEVGIMEVLSVAELLGKRPRTRIIGVQPKEVEAVGLELTAPLQEALPRVVEAVVEELRGMGVELAEKSNYSSPL